MKKTGIYLNTVERSRREKLNRRESNRKGSRKKMKTGGFITLLFVKKFFTPLTSRIQHKIKIKKRKIKNALKKTKKEKETERI